MAINGNGGSWSYEGSVTVGVWAKKGGVWQKIAQDYVYVYGGDGYPTGGAKPFSWSWDNTYQMGSGVQAVGLTIDSYSGSAAAITAFSHTLFQAQGAAGGDRSATPGGQKSTVTVRP